MNADNEKELILAVNPGATSTKLAVFDGTKLIIKKTIEHSVDDLEHYHSIFDQFQYRMDLIVQTLAETSIDPIQLKAVVGRGGLLKPVAGGTYLVNEQMIEDMKKAERGEHASNLGPVLAYSLAEKTGVPAFIVDPVSVDEMEPVARVSGYPDMPRLSFVHALNMKAVARKVAAEMGRPYQELSLIVAHLGTGVSVTPHKNGRMIDVSNGKDEGAFSPDRCGGLPLSQIVKLCYSGKYTQKEVQNIIFGKGGIYAYLGTKDIREVEAMASDGNEQAELVLEALAYQVAKEIGSMAAVLEGQIDRIILTGGIAYSRRIVGDIIRRVQFLAQVTVVPGEEELESLALGALRVLRGEEEAKNY